MHRIRSLGVLGEFTFWIIAFVAVVPLLITTVNGIDAQLTLFALFFALLWGLILKKYVINDDQNWKHPLAVLLFTGVVGIPLLLFAYKHLLPDFYLRWPDHANPVVSLFGFILQVGLCEELLKLLPVLLVIGLTRGRKTPLQVVTLGVFSGLGFAAFENLSYGDRMVNDAYALTLDYGTQGLVAGVERAVINSMLRAISLVLCHAVFSGIAAYFLAQGQRLGRRREALAIAGLSIAATLHGLYDWLAGIQMTIGALVIGFSFALFFLYVRLIRTDPSTALPGR